MAITHSTAARDAMADAVVDLVDAGTTDTTGDFVFMDSGDTVLCSLSWSATPAFGDSASGTATMNTINKGTVTTAAATSLFKLQDRDNTEVFRGTVTVAGGGGDVELSSVDLEVGDEMLVSTFTYSAAP